MKPQSLIRFVFWTFWDKLRHSTPRTPLGIIGCRCDKTGPEIYCQSHGATIYGDWIESLGYEGWHRESINILISLGHILLRQWRCTSRRSCPKRPAAMQCLTENAERCQELEGMQLHALVSIIILDCKTWYFPLVQLYSEEIGTFSLTCCLVKEKKNWALHWKAKLQKLSMLAILYNYYYGLSAQF